MMIAVLQRFGGLRASDGFHLFVQDVEPQIIDPGDSGWGTEARVTLYHPQDGITRFRDPLTRRVITAPRSVYLQTVYGRVPRCDPRVGRDERVGWKNLLIENEKLQCSRVYWFPREWGRLFWRLYDMYVRHVLPAGLDHPYLWVNTKGDSTIYGAPYRLGSYYDALERAVTRIGLKSLKELGTTSHGLRHAYGQVLGELKVPQKIITVMMHHNSVQSQAAYTAPSNRFIEQALAAAHQRINSPDPHDWALAANVLPPAAHL